jgi:hypothetical protein
VGGWIFDRDAPQQRARLTVAIGDTAVTGGVADLFREGVKRAGKSDGGCGFKFTFPNPLTLEELRELSVRVDGTDFRFIPGRRFLVQCPPVLARPRLACGMSRRFRRCVLHIGTERTGSTSLQSFLAANRALLMEKGYYAPVSTVRPRGLSSWALVTYALNSFYIRSQSRRIEGIKDATSLALFRERLVSELSEELMHAPCNCDTLVFSSEHCSSELLLRHELEQVRALLDLWCDSYSVVVYLRSQLSLAASASSMLLKAGHYDPRLQVSNEKTRPGAPREYLPYFD